MRKRLLRPLNAAKAYLSPAAGYRCITFARLFRNLETKKLFILCADINTEQ